MDSPRSHHPQPITSVTAIYKALSVSMQAKSMMATGNLNKANKAYRGDKGANNLPTFSKPKRKLQTILIHALTSPAFCILVGEFTKNNKVYSH